MILYRPTADVPVPDRYLDALPVPTLMQPRAPLQTYVDSWGKDALRISRDGYRISPARKPRKS